MLWSAFSRGIRGAPFGIGSGHSWREAPRCGFGHHLLSGRFPPVQPLQAAATNLDFTVEDLRIVLVDDVLFTGRTIRAAMDALLAHGRPSTVELAVLVDHGFRRELPIEPKYVGRSVDSLDSQRVKVIWSSTMERRGPRRIDQPPTRPWLILIASCSASGDFIRYRGRLKTHGSGGHRRP